MSDGMTWLVQQFIWRKFSTSPQPQYVRLPGTSTVAEFDDREDAEADRWHREHALRERVNPFRCGVNLTDSTHLPDYAFKDYLLDDSIRPAKYDSYAQINWGKWWDKHSPGWNFDRRNRIWEVLDKVRFFEVVGREPDRQLFVAVEAVTDFHPSRNWDRRWYDFSGYGTDGGRPVRAFLARADADAHLELAAEAAGDAPRTQIHADPFSQTDARIETPADRVYHVALDHELPVDQLTVFITCRVGLALASHSHWRFRGWEFDEYETGEVRWSELHSSFDGFPSRQYVRRPRLVPEAAFTTREAAEADAFEREQTTRRWFNPSLIDELARAHLDHEWETYERMPRVNNTPDTGYEKAWAAFPSLRLHTVLEIELDAI